MQAIVESLLANKETDNHLYTLKDIDNVRQWNYELPTLTSKGRFTDRQHWNSAKEFEDTLFNRYPFFEEIDLTDIAILGGSIFDILHCREDSVSDFDLFICGKDYHSESSSSEISKEVETKIIQRAEKFIDDIYHYLEKMVKNVNEEAKRETNREVEPKKSKYYPVTRGKPTFRPKNQVSLTSYTNKLKATRNGPVITFSIPELTIPVQLVLAPNASVQDLLRRVDLDCTAIAYYEGEVYFNSISRFCMENACAIIGHSKNDLFEERLSKYFEDKGVDIILPYLDLTKIPRRNLQYGVSEVIDLPSLAIVYEEITEKKLFTSSLDPCTPEEENKEEETPTFGKPYSYDSSSKGQKSSGTIVHENIVHLLHDKPEKFQYHGEGKFLKDVLLPIPKLTDRMITNSYETVCEKLCSSKGALDLLTVEKYFVFKKTSTILEEILVQPMKEKEAKELSLNTSLFNEQYEKRLKTYFEELVKVQITHTREKLEKLKEDYNKNPSKFPIVANIALFNRPLIAKEWYGQYVVSHN